MQHKKVNRKKRNNNRREQGVQEMVQSLDQGIAAVSNNFIADSFQNQAEIHSSSRDAMMRMVRQSGTNVEMNAQDPYGDGDQSPVYGKKAEILRSLWSSGADFFDLIQEEKLSGLHMLCFTGDYQALEKVLTDPTLAPEAKKQLLERREGILRQPPITTCVVGAKCLVPTPISDHLKVARLLIQHGANVNAKDIAGHTPCFHAGGGLSTPRTLPILKELVQAGGSVNLQNRFGSVPMAEAIMTSNLPAIRALLESGADLDVEDLDGITPRKMMKSPSVMKVISEFSTSKECRQAWKEENKVCAAEGCEKVGVKRCGACRQVAYCSQECQKAHWRQHKVKCKEAQAKGDDVVEIVPTKVPGGITTVVNGATGKQFTIQTSGPIKAPPLVKDGGEFHVKVQANPGAHHLVNDETRTVLVMVPPTHPRYNDILQVVQSKGVAGLKAYFSARVQDGKLHLLLNRIHSPSTHW